MSLRDIRRKIHLDVDTRSDEPNTHQRDRLIVKESADRIVKEADRDDDIRSLLEKRDGLTKSIGNAAELGQPAADLIEELDRVNNRLEAFGVIQRERAKG